MFDAPGSDLGSPMITVHEHGYAPTQRSSSAIAREARRQRRMAAQKVLEHKLAAAYAQIELLERELRELRSPMGILPSTVSGIRLPRRRREERPHIQDAAAAPDLHPSRYLAAGPSPSDETVEPDVDSSRADEVERAGGPS